jgi:DNA-binding transcriptional ArsR family regulator
VRARVILPGFDGRSKKAKAAALVGASYCSIRTLQMKFDARQTSVDGSVLHHPDLAEIDLPSLLHALSDPVRLEIVRSLACSEGGELSCGAIRLPISKATASHHFKVLRLAGVIEQHDVGTRRINALRHEALEARFPGLLDSVLRAAQAEELAAAD